jgi:membrane associated rhomboid family serine protease
LFPIGDKNKPTIRPYINYTLLIINVIVFFLFYLSSTEQFFWGIINLGVIPSYIVTGERLWTLLSSTFMHADPIHLFGNLLYLWVFGDNIEDALGHGKYLLFYLLGGIIASLLHVASVAISAPSNGLMQIPSVGASGAVSAVLGAYLILYPKARIRTLIIRFFITIIDVRAMFYLGFWFIYQFLMGISP